MKKILYIDMDGVLVDFESGKAKLDERTLKEYGDDVDNVPGIYGLMIPKNGAVEAFKILSEHFDTYVLSTAPWKNPSAWSDKLEWVKKYLGKNAHKRLILSHHKNLNKGDYLIDDNLRNGADKFEGEHIHFGKGKFNDWDLVLEYLLPGKRD